MGIFAPTDRGKRMITVGYEEIIRLNTGLWVMLDRSIRLSEGDKVSDGKLTYTVKACIRPCNPQTRKRKYRIEIEKQIPDYPEPH